MIEFVRIAFAKRGANHSLKDINLIVKGECILSW